MYMRSNRLPVTISLESVDEVNNLMSEIEHITRVKYVCPTLYTLFLNIRDAIEDADKREEYLRSLNK